MKVVIPMAGYGKRLRPHTYSRPKPLINVAGQPMLKHLLDPLGELEIEEYIFIVGYLGEQIEEYISANYGFKASFVIQEELIGQAHAVYLAREHLNGPAIVLFADTLFETDLSVINTTDADAVAFVKEVEDPRRFGVVEVDAGGHVTRFIEKPDSVENKQVVIGLYYIRDSQHMIRAIETQMARKHMTKGEFFLADAFQIMIEEGAAFRTQNVEVWLDCGKPETVLGTNRYLLDNGFDNSHTVRVEGVTVIPPAHVDPDARLENAIIGPYATISAGCHVSSSIIRDSIIDRGARVSDALLMQSLVGRNAHVSGRYCVINVGDESSVDFS
jgi:glucose-1-phosphate thymidylyltransferase